jgi:hypothetical protein
MKYPNEITAKEQIKKMKSKVNKTTEINEMN